MVRLRQIVLVLAALGLLAGIAAGALFYALVLRDLPTLRSLGDYRPNLITRVYANDGTEIGSFFKERRIIVPVERIPRHVVNAFIAAEDSAFYEHEGLDYPGILRALVANLRAGGVRQGGSTITQQVAKTFLLSSERSIKRKLQDMILAKRIEDALDKDQILYLYLNQIYLGSGAYGIEAAARTYFGKPVEELTLAEGSMIAGLVPAPSVYTPRRSPSHARSRQQFVLRRMVEVGYITEEEREAALAQDLPLVAATFDETRAAASYFVEEVRRYLVQRYGFDEVLTGGLEVFTTADPARQRDAYEALRRGLREVDRRSGYRGPERTAAREEWPALLAALGEANRTEPYTDRGLARGLVTEVDDGKGVARVALGPDRTTTLELEDVRWARKPDPKVDGSWTRVRSIGAVLAPGDVIWLAKEDTPADPRPGADPGAPVEPDYTLSQEPEVEGALVAIDLETHRLQALVGGYSFERSEFDRAVQSRRQPGSAFKPVVYAAALERGFTPASIVYDTPIVYEDATGMLWKPENYSERFYGPLTLRNALAHSRNVATIKLLGEVGIASASHMARALGIRTKLEENLSLALGTSEVTLAELVRAYTAFATGGRLVDPVFILEIRDREGNVLERDVPLLASLDATGAGDGAADPGQATLAELAVESTPPAPDEESDAESTDADAAQDPFGSESLPAGHVLDPVTAYLMTDMLRAVVEEGTGQRVRALGRPVAGKTGTTNELHDAWFIGFTPEIVTGVWVGYDNARSLGRNETGSRVASPIFLEYMRRALAGRPPSSFAVPPGIDFVRIDEQTGQLATPGDSDARFQPFRAGTSPQEIQPTTDGESPLVRRPRLD